MSMTYWARARRAAQRRGEGWCEKSAIVRLHALGLPCRIWNTWELREQLQASLIELGRLLEDVATEQRWLKCRDSNGVVRAIALPRNHPDRDLFDLETHRALMLDRVVTRGMWEAAA
jgi:hypothetical protein